MGGIRELLDGKIWEWNLFQMGMGMKSLKWEGNGTKNLFPHTSSARTLVVLGERHWWQILSKRKIIRYLLSVAFAGAFLYCFL